MDPALIADIVLVAHFVYAGFVVFGFLAIGAGWPLGWPWVRNRLFRYFHVAAMGFVGIEAAIGMACPLTELEFALRRNAGLGGEEGTFIGRIVSRLLYYDFPPWAFTATYIVLTVLAVALLFLLPPGKKRR